MSNLDAFTHFVSITWMVLFCLIPPKNYNKGFSSFVVSLAFIGLLTAIVGEFAELFGCVIGLKPSVTAISFVALGTSLPDTLASRTAAREAPNADSAIGNITGSNSVNVFLGLGIPWIIASIYYAIKGEVYYVKTGDLAFSVAIFLITFVFCFISLILRRKVSIFVIPFNFIIYSISVVNLVVSQQVVK